MGEGVGEGGGRGGVTVSSVFTTAPPPPPLTDSLDAGNPGPVIAPSSDSFFSLGSLKSAGRKPALTPSRASR